MFTILGANGSIGKPLAQELARMGKKVRLVSRNPQAVMGNEELFAADLTNPQDVDSAVAGSEVVLVTIGFEYTLAVWQKTWPPFIQAVVDACLKHKAKLVFFDNIYMLDAAQLANITEQTPIKPKTGKGEVRAQVNKIIWEAVNNRGLTAMIVRGADFIAPRNTAFASTVLEKLKKGEPAGWLINADVLHNFTYAPDAGSAVAWLATANDTWNQVWLAPTTEALTGRQWVQRAADVLGVKAKVQVLPSWLLITLGWFMPQLKEVGELRYQWATDYVVRSDKFFNHFPDFVPTPTDEAIAATAKQIP